MTAGAAPPARTRPPFAAASAAVVVLIALALYWPALGAGFVGDDFMILHRLGRVEEFAEALRFFRGEFFEYYRPLGFLSHAIDWTIAGADARQFHRTNLLLHAINGLLVFGIAHALAARAGVQTADGRAAGTTVREQRPSIAGRPQSWAIAGPIAALLFVLHASSHEAVVWISARFDLLATAWALAAVWWMVSGAPGSRWGPPLLFLPAVLSKESTVALPIAAAAWAVFGRRATTRDTIARLAPWIVVLVVYALLRQAAGGVPATGGAARAPKLIALAAVIGLLIGCASGRWLRLRNWMLARQGFLAVCGIVAAAAAGLAWSLPLGSISALVREKLTVAGFVIYYLFTPWTEAGTGAGYLEPLGRIYAGAALAGVPLLGLVVWSLRRRLLNADAAWFLAALLVATLLPISALTEGRRYLYLPSAVVSIAAGAAVAALGGRARAMAVAAVAVFLAVSSARIAGKIDDWIWAGAMTADGARLADEALAPACDAGHVVFLTSPVGVRGVYTHFYYETFELPRGCTPETFQIVARVVRVDTRVEARWIDRHTIVLTIPQYRGNVVLSEDLRRFDLPLADVRSRAIVTPLGELRAEPAGASQQLILRLDPGQGASLLFFYFSDGRIRRLPAFPG